MKKSVITDQDFSVNGVKSTTAKQAISFADHLKNLISIYDVAQTAAREHYVGLGLRYCDVPYNVGITGACESINTLYRVVNKLGVPMFESQTGQLMLEFALQHFPGVFTTIHSFRDEGREDARHLLEFLLLEEEFGWDLVEGDVPYDQDMHFEHLLNRIERVAKSMVEALISRLPEVLENGYGLVMSDIQAVLAEPFARITYSEAVCLLKDNGFPELTWGDDLSPIHEQAIVSLLNNNHISHRSRPVFVTKYPEGIKFFNMQPWHKNPQVVLSADLLLPWAGESAGSAVRIHDGKLLKQRLIESKMFAMLKPYGIGLEHFTWYVDDTISAGVTPPHAGYGLGLARFVQWILGFTDIRYASLFSLMAAKTGDFNPDKQGLGVMFKPQTAVLVSLSDQSKPELLEYILAAGGNGTVFYATPGTSQFLNDNGVVCSTVHKVGSPESPNLVDLISQRVFTSVINIPSPDGSTNTDGEKIRELCVDHGVYLLTDQTAVKRLLSNIVHNGH